MKTRPLLRVCRETIEIPEPIENGTCSTDCPLYEIWVQKGVSDETQANIGLPVPIERSWG